MPDAGWRRHLRRLPGVVPLRDGVKSLLSPRFRSEQRLRREHPAGLFQVSTTTYDDRYPRIFSFLRDQLAGLERPRLLSFGCATGEEVFSLHRYLPRAEILGVDINPWAIATARRRLRAAGGGERIAFEHGGTPGRLPVAAFDAVLCLAVLRHGDLAEPPQRERCDPILFWHDFAAMVAGLDHCLRPGGWLALRHCNFRFADTATAAGYEPALVLIPPPDAPITPLFGPDNRRLAGACHDAVFRKCRENAPPAEAGRDRNLPPP